jgi:hypothetical protein
MIKIKQMLFSAALASISMTSLTGLQAFAQIQNNSYKTITEQSIMPRYKYITSANLDFSVSSSKASYRIYIQGDNITKISGTLTLYKDGEYVTSKRITENSNMLNTSGTLTASGRGSYELTFNGTVSTRNGSETITISETDSY